MAFSTNNGPVVFQHSILTKLSIRLINTYKLINKVYYETKQQQEEQEHNKEKNSEVAATVGSTSTASASKDDDEYNYILSENEILNGRYEVKTMLGKGSFGIVAEAIDLNSRDALGHSLKTSATSVAIKIIKNKPAFLKQAKRELTAVRSIINEDPKCQNCCVRYISDFTLHGHLCIVFELLSFNLYELIRSTDFKGVSLGLIRNFTKQLLKALVFLKSKSMNLLHCDLKPENILLVNPRKCAIRLIDFGSCCKSGENIFTYIQSRFYRSPEVLFGLPYSFPIDVWSLGCIMVELHTGKPIFDGRNELDQINKICEVLGFPPPAMMALAYKRSKRRVNRNFQKSTIGLVPKDCINYKSPGSRTLSSILGSQNGGPGGRRKGERGHTAADYSAFEDLITAMLKYNPSERISPEDALLHPFLLKGRIISRE